MEFLCLLFFVNEYLERKISCMPLACPFLCHSKHTYQIRTLHWAGRLRAVHEEIQTLYIRTSKFNSYN